MTEETQPPAPVTAQAAPPPAPLPAVVAPAQPVKTAAASSNMPKRGHLLPGFLRSKASKEKEAQEDAAAAELTEVI